ncbi:MAG: pyrroline-5-carboxylate reductase [Solirubrobacterales bacterium]
MIVGLIGAGNMGGALARGWASADTGPDKLLIADAVEQQARALADDVDGKRAKSSVELAQDADVIVLAMKPAGLLQVASEIRVTVSERRLPIVSILGGTGIARIEEAFGPGAPIVRFMPNIAAEVRAGTFCYTSNEALDERTERALLDLFGLLGVLVSVDERLMDAATAISGCGPAFYAMVVEALVDAGVKEGLTARQASELAITTMAGTAALLERHEGDTVSLRRKVTSPGGTTAAGVAALEHHHLRVAFMAAVEAVVHRADELHPPAAGDKGRST